MGLFRKGEGQVKFLIVITNYITKWIEAEALAQITATNIIKFFKQDILSRFGVPLFMVNDKGTQFGNKKISVTPRFPNF